MAEHEVTIRQMPEVELLNKDLQISIKADGAAFGTLTISKGGLGWVPSGPSGERHFNWEQFARYVKDWKG
jgi:hypothetical protein